MSIKLVKKGLKKASQLLLVNGQLLATYIGEALIVKWVTFVPALDSYHHPVVDDITWHASVSLEFQRVQIRVQRKKNCFSVLPAATNIEKKSSHLNNAFVSSSPFIEKSQRKEKGQSELPNWRSKDQIAVIFFQL